MAVHTTDSEVLSPTAAERARFASKIDVQDNGCWLWTGSLFTAGYGAFKLRGQNRRAHRVLWVWEFGPVPDGLLLDHLCHPADCAGGPQCLHRRCVNPEHLAAVPQRSNLLRSPQTPNAQNVAKTHCPEGHEYSAENTRTWTRRGSTMRSCKTCHRNREAARRAAARR